MPRDRLALAVRISCKVQSLGFSQRARDGIDVARALLELLILHREAVIGVDRPFLRHEVAHVAVGGENFKVLPQVLLDGACLRGGFHDDEIFSHARATTADGGSMRPARMPVRHQVFESLEGEILARLTREHHEHDPLQLLGVELIGIQRKHSINHDFALQRQKYP